MKSQTSPLINSQKSTIEFCVMADTSSYISVAGASQVALAGSFNNWAQDVLLMHPDSEGMWKIEIPMLPKGTYHYKFFVDDKMWMEDVENPNREPDGLTGFYSVLTI